MNYQETLDYLYNSVPMFQQVGSSAYKEGLENTHALDEFLGHPHTTFQSIHIAGTNGKGSCSHTLAAILQSAGYKVGLYTSPHLVDFRERIRINGETISQEYVIRFVESHRSFFEPLHPSFFELTTAMAFRYFADRHIDVAVIEVGLGGRLDCTNIIHPDLSIITNISFDHMQFLGNTLAKIATEKAGIIKKGVPVVIGETTEETKPVFLQKAQEVEAPIIFAEEEQRLKGATKFKTCTNRKWTEYPEKHSSAVQAEEAEAVSGWIYENETYPELEGVLGGSYQLKNTNTLLSALPILRKSGYKISDNDVRNGFRQVDQMTGLQGRWQKLRNSPTIICDTGHNVAGISYIVEQLKQMKYERLHMVIGMVNDKDVSGVLALLPKNAVYYFTKASVKRALSETLLQQIGASAGLQGNTYPDVQSAVKAAQEKSLPEDLIFVGGSSFIVADLLSCRDTLDLD